ncbi:MAG: hypothetical protein GF364_01465 [Candidatus Lokiarchaeota archaeon]|nr:hypothetical protein [Candidatus Lokiarchaeota archaeon]
MPKEFKEMDEDDINAPAFFEACNGIRITAADKCPNVLTEEIGNYETLVFNPKDMLEEDANIVKKWLWKARQKAKSRALKRAKKRAKLIKKIRSKKKKKIEMEPLLKKHPSNISIAKGTENVTPQFIMKKIWAYQSAQKYHKPVRKHSDKTHKNYINIKELSYTITKNTVKDGKFERIKKNGEIIEDLSYFEAKSLVKKIGSKQIMMKKSIYATKKGRRK